MRIFSLLKIRNILVITLAFLLSGCQVIAFIPSKVIDRLSNSPTPTPLAISPISAGYPDPNEPVFIYGDIPYTSPFFVNTMGEAFVLLEDQAGMITRDQSFEFPIASQIIGPVEVSKDGEASYNLSLPSVPQGRFFDLDNDNEEEPGVQVFAVAYWSNTWGGPFLEDREGGGWSTAYTSTITDSENEDEITGGTLIVWAPDNKQAFPMGFGEDGLLFTEDDPTSSIPAGYSIVDLNQQPFQVSKQARTQLSLIEGEIAKNDFSSENYLDAFESLFSKASKEYPFTNEKNVDWQNIYSKVRPLIENARNDQEFFYAVQEFLKPIPDGHIGMSGNIVSNEFFKLNNGGLGLVLQELSNGQVVATQVIQDFPAFKAGIQPGAEIIEWNKLPVSEAILNVDSTFENFSTEHARRNRQLAFLPRGPSGEKVSITFRNPGTSENSQQEVSFEEEFASLFAAIPAWSSNPLALPIESSIIEGTDIGLLKINTFSDDYHLIANLWDRAIKKINEQNASGLIIDLRNNGGGSGGLALDLAGYFFDQEAILGQSYYYNDLTNDFESTGLPTKITPSATQFNGPITVLVGSDCASACELLAYALSQGDRATLIGETPTAGMFGEVGRGQYKLPGNLELQIPTGKTLSPEGFPLIEGSGVSPDILLPVTEESVFNEYDPVLFAAIQHLQNQ